MVDTSPAIGQLPDPVPSLVAKLAEQVHMTPIAWHLFPEMVIIVFREGQKLTFDRKELEVKAAAASRGGHKPPSAASEPRGSEDPAPVAIKRQVKPK
jgi:hypothetical protein